MTHLLDTIDTRRNLVRETADQLCERITELGERPAAERTPDRLRITRATVLELAAENGTEPFEPLPPGYPELLAAFKTHPQAHRAKDLRESLGTGTEPCHVETTRAELKRLVTRGLPTRAQPLVGHLGTCPSTRSHELSRGTLGRATAIRSPCRGGRAVTRGDI